MKLPRAYDAVHNEDTSESLNIMGFTYDGDSDGNFDIMKISLAKILHVETSSPNCGIARAALSAQEYEETKIEALPMPLKYSVLIW